MREVDLTTSDGRVLHAYDVGATGHPDELAVLWHGGTPNTGAPPEPLFEVARSLGFRWIGYDRPSYGGSSPHHGAMLPPPHPTPVRSRITCRSRGSRFSATPAAVRAPSLVPRCSPIE